MSTIETVVNGIRVSDEASGALKREFGTSLRADELVGIVLQEMNVAVFSDSRESRDLETGAPYPNVERIMYVHSSIPKDGTNASDGWITVHAVMGKKPVTIKRDGDKVMLYKEKVVTYRRTPHYKLKKAKREHLRIFRSTEMRKGIFLPGDFDDLKASQFGGLLFHHIAVEGPHINDITELTAYTPNGANNLRTYRGRRLTFLEIAMGESRGLYCLEEIPFFTRVQVKLRDM
ncbi:hypothetical protein J4475_00965 [Candidatus Woesearchaeota archaeon]|nr:hypothetical protein [Candidatus Woesearchaeota archaeon]